MGIGLPKFLGKKDGYEILDDKSHKNDKKNFEERVIRYKNREEYPTAIRSGNIFHGKTFPDADESTSIRQDILSAHARLFSKDFEKIRNKYTISIDNVNDRLDQIIKNKKDPIRIGQEYFMAKYPDYVDAGNTAEDYIKAQYRETYPDDSASPDPNYDTKIQEHADRFFSALYLQKSLEDAHEYRADLIRRYEALVKTRDGINERTAAKNNKYINELRELAREVKANIKTFQLLEGVVKEIANNPGEHVSNVNLTKDGVKTEFKIKELYKNNNFFVAGLKEKDKNKPIYEGGITFAKLKTDSLKFKTLITNLAHVSQYKMSGVTNFGKGIWPGSDRTSVDNLQTILTYSDFVNDKNDTNDISNIPTKEFIKKAVYDKDPDEIKAELELLEQKRKEKRINNTYVTVTIFLVSFITTMILGFSFVEEIEFFGEPAEQVSGQDNDVNQSVTTQEPNTADNELGNGNEHNDDTYIDPGEYGEAKDIDNTIECSAANPCESVTVTQGEEVTTTKTSEPARAAVVTTASLLTALAAAGIKSAADKASKGVRSAEQEQSLARNIETAKYNDNAHVNRLAEKSAKDPSTSAETSYMI